jgi:hypothetical protein
VFFEVSQNDTSPAAAAYQVKLDLTSSNSGVTFGTPIRTDGSSPSRTPLFNLSPDPTGSTSTSILATELLPSGSTPILDQTGLLRVPFTVAPGTSGTFNLNFDYNSNRYLSNSLLAGGNGSSIPFTPQNGVLTITSPTPEPSSVVLLLFGAAAFSLISKKIRCNRLSRRSLTAS